MAEKTKKQKKRWGDRPDGRRVRDVDALHALIPFLMPNRCDAEVFLRESIDVTALKAYLAEKNAQQDFKTTIFHAVVTAAAKTIYHRPLLNRFIVGKHFYDRNVITLCFMAKKQFADHAEEVQMILEAKPEDTLTGISRHIAGDVHQARTAKKEEEDHTIEGLSHLPRWLMGILMAGFRFLEKHGWLPASLCKIDPNHTTVMLSNLGSIRCGAAYHHLNNFGTGSFFITIGYIEPRPTLMPDGTLQMRDTMDLCFTVDERVADGFYFARSIQLLKKYLTDPALLDRPIGEEE